MKIELLDAYSGQGAHDMFDDAGPAQLVIAGHWSDSPHHSGYIDYYLYKIGKTWVLESSERNTDLDGITEEDVEEGALNDDQIQAMWGMTLEEAQNQDYRCVVAVCRDAPDSADSRTMANKMYLALDRNDYKLVNERHDDEGLLASKNF